MKKIALVFLVMAGTFTAMAQTEKNDWMIGGTFRINTSDNNTEITLAPNAGIFVVDNLAIGGNFSLGYSKSGNNKYTSFSVGPFARYYFTTESQTVRPILHGNFNYLSTKTKIGSSASSTNTGTSFFVGGGAAAFISSSVSLDILAGYARTKYSDYDGSGGFALSVGFQVYINKGQMENVTRRKRSSN